MASKLNLRIKEMYDRAKKTGTKAEETASSIGKDLESKVISIQKSKIPFLSKLRVRSSEFFKDHNIDIKYLLLIIPIIAIFLLVREAQRQQDFRSRAGIHTASVTFQLQNWTLPPENSFGIWINSDSPVTFANINITYDPKLVKLTHEISPSGTLTRIVKITSMAEANSTGNISIVLALEPSRAVSPPGGAFQVASLVFNTNTGNPDVATTVNFNTNQMQLVASDESIFQLTATNLNLILNPTPTPTPSPTPSPTPIPEDTTSPVVIITNPEDGSSIPAKGSFSIQTVASDESGVAKISIAFDGKTSKNCSNTTTCRVNMAVNKISTGSHTITVTVTDKSPNKNTASTTINVTK
jgi:hypothetical protein